MAEWKKVVVSGSAAILSQLNVGANQQITTAQNTTFLTGSFTGSFVGNGAGLTGVTATAIFPTSQVSNITSTDKFFVSQSSNEFITYGNLLTDLAGTNLTVEGTDSLTLASQILVTGITSSLFGTASWANNATNATNTTNTAVTDTTTGTGPYYITFVDATTGNLAQRIDSTGLTYNATTNTITATASFAAQALSASFASTAPYSGLTGVPAGIVSASVLSSPAQGQALLTTNGVAGSTIDLGLETGDSPTFAGLTTNGNIAINNGTSTALTTTGTTAALFNTNATTLNIGGAATTISVGSAAGTTTFNGNTIVQGNFTVNGTTTIIDTTNITVEDRFIMVNHGSGSISPTQEGGIIVEGTTADSGSAFYYDGDTTQRWGVALGVAESAVSVAANSFVVTVSGSASNPSGNPVYGGATNGYGNMYVNTSDSSIWIYA